MDNENDAAIAADTDTDTEPDASDYAGAHASATEKRLRRLTGRSAAYRGQIVATTRAWVSRDSKVHVLAARFLDFAVLTPEHLVLCSTGFFTRRPRRRVFREPLSRLVVIPRGPEPFRTLRIVGDFDKPILLELRDKPDSIAFARALLARTKAETDAGPLSNHSPADAAAGTAPAVEYEHSGSDPTIEPPPAP